MYLARLQQRLVRLRSSRSSPALALVNLTFRSTVAGTHRCRGREEKQLHVDERHPAQNRAHTYGTFRSRSVQPSSFVWDRVCRVSHREMDDSA